MVRDGSNINELITYIDHLSLLASDPIRGVDEDLKAQYLIGSIQRSDIAVLNEVLAVHEQLQSPYSVLVTALQAKCSTLMINDHGHTEGTDFVSSQTSVSKANSKASRACNYCQKVGHTAENCWKRNKCNYCEKTGHNPWYCYDNPKSSNYKGKKNYSEEKSVADTTGNLETISLGKSFREKYPQNP